MSNLSSIARPYALAAFQYARDTERLLDWKKFLDNAATIAEQPDIVRLLKNEKINDQDIFQIFDELLKENVSERNFLHLLSQNKRWQVLPEIANIYNHYYTELVKESTVKVTTAIKASDAFLKTLKTVLKKRTKHDIILQCEIDPNIIGGAIIHIGDRVIDGSIRGKLNRLLETLTD